MCYYTNWSQYRPKIGKFVPEDITPDLCTHIIFAFGWLKKGKISSFESNDETKDGKTGLYERIDSLKKANPKLQTLLAIGKVSSNALIYNFTIFLIVFQVAGPLEPKNSRTCPLRGTPGRRSSTV